MQRIIRKISSFFSRSKTSSDSFSHKQVTPVIVKRQKHGISRKQIDKSALDVLYGLKRAGYDGYLVGGCVRDLLLGLEPKDFDVVTNAEPDQVKSVFRQRCRLIGRRFRLAHVRFGRMIIEVATFRGQGDGNGRKDRFGRNGKPQVQQDRLMIVAVYCVTMFMAPLMKMSGAVILLSMHLSLIHI